MYTGQKPKTNKIYIIIVDFIRPLTHSGLGSIPRHRLRQPTPTTIKTFQSQSRIARFLAYLLYNVGRLVQCVSLSDWFGWLGINNKYSTRKTGLDCWLDQNPPSSRSPAPPSAPPLAAVSAGPVGGERAAVRGTVTAGRRGGVWRVHRVPVPRAFHTRSLVPVQHTAYHTLTVFYFDYSLSDLLAVCRLDGAVDCVYRQEGPGRGADLAV